MVKSVDAKLRLFEWENDTLLHTAVYYNKLETIYYYVLESVPERRACVLITQQCRTDASSVVLAVESKNIETLECIFDHIPEEQLLNVMEAQDSDGVTAMH